MMDGHSIHSMEALGLLLLTLVLVFVGLARRVQMPYPIVLVLGGLVLSLVPGLPKIPLNPDLVLLVALPPLLYAAAWTTSWREFRFNLVSILLLAFGLVGFTVAGVAFASAHLLPGFDWQSGFLLGAVVSTTDALAATSIARQVGLPQRIVDVLEGESLLNDASGLLALEFGISMLVKGEHPTVGYGVLRLLYLVGCGVGVGLLAGLIVDQLERLVDDEEMEVTFSILVPYMVYLGAESLHASGVLAVVACGLFLSHKSVEFFSPRVRIAAYGVWQTLNFVLNACLFILIGFQLPYVRGAITAIPMRELLMYGGAVSVLVIVLRLLWMPIGAPLAFWIRRRLLKQDMERPSARQVLVVGWTGMRGVVALAAALSLPTNLENGQPLPHRALIIFLSFSVIVVTLVGQGLLLPPLIRLLGLGGTTEPDCEIVEARRRMIEAALERLEGAKAAADEFESVYDKLSTQYRSRLVAVTGDFSSVDGVGREHVKRYQDLTRELLEVERSAAIRLRDEGHINDATMRRLEHELDLAAARYGE